MEKDKVRRKNFYIVCLLQLYRVLQLLIPLLKSFQAGQHTLVCVGASERVCRNNKARKHRLDPQSAIRDEKGGTDVKLQRRN